MHLKKKSRLLQLLFKRAADIQSVTVKINVTLTVIMTYILLTSFVHVKKENMTKSKTVHGKAGIMYIIKLVKTIVCTYNIMYSVLLKQVSKLAIINPRRHWIKSFFLLPQKHTT